MKEVDQLFKVSRDLFDLPNNAKEEYLNNPPKSFLGYAGLVDL
jgi:isopenicillin N synthase-like dioxygenase